MTIDISALDRLPAESAGLLPCTEVTCDETCNITCNNLTCNGCFTSYTRE